MRIRRPGQHSSGENINNDILRLPRTSTTLNSKKTVDSQAPNMDEVTFKVNGDLGTMTEDWSLEELYDSRRIVVFRRFLSRSALEINFGAGSPNTGPYKDFCISCIKRGDVPGYYFTQYDIIRLAESFLMGPLLGGFSAEGKRQILYILDNFDPLTVSKVKAETEDLFKLIMGLSNPQSSNFEVEIEVHRWETLLPALETIMSRYNSLLKINGKNRQPTNIGSISGEWDWGSARSHKFQLPAMTDYKPEDSNLPEINLDERQLYISGLADSFLSIVNGLHPDEDALKRISDIFPNLLEGFALRIGHKAPRLMHSNILNFVFNNRQ